MEVFIYCDQRWIKVKKDIFISYQNIPINFIVIFSSKFNKYTLLTMRKTNNFKNLKKAVIENKIDIIVPTEDKI